LAVVFLALPHAIGWFGFVDGRVVPLLLILPLLAVPEGALGPRLARVLAIGAPAAATAIAALALGASYAFQAQAPPHAQTPPARAVSRPPPPERPPQRGLAGPPLRPLRQAHAGRPPHRA